MINKLTDRISKGEVHLASGLVIGQSYTLRSNPNAPVACIDYIANNQVEYSLVYSDGVSPGGSRLHYLDFKLKFNAE